MVTSSKPKLPTNWPTPGTTVSIPFFLFVTHSGIVSDRWHGGKPTVISNSARAGGVTEESWDMFSDGLTPSVVDAPTNLNAIEIVRRARTKIGTSYQLLNWNCDSLVTFARGEKPYSVQLAGLIALSVLGFIISTQR